MLTSECRDKCATGREKQKRGQSRKKMCLMENMAAVWGVGRGAAARHMQR